MKPPMPAGSIIKLRKQPPAMRHLKIPAGSLFEVIQELPGGGASCGRVTVRCCNTGYERNLSKWWFDALSPLERLAMEAV